MDAINEATAPGAPTAIQRILNMFLEVLPARLAKLTAQGLVCESGVTIKTPTRLTLGRGVVIQRRAILHCGGKRWSDYKGYIDLGDHVVVGPGVFLYGAGCIEVGAYTHFGPGSMIMTQSGDAQSTNRRSKTPGHIVEPVTIGSGVWIGAGAVILGGTQLGDDCMVGPNSVVKGNFPPGSSLIGNPARLVRQRSQQAKP